VDFVAAFAVVFANRAVLLVNLEGETTPSGHILARKFLVHHYFSFALAELLLGLQFLDIRMLHNLVKRCILSNALSLLF